MPDHWHQMAEFCRWEMAAGGPDPHMATAGRMVHGRSLRDRLWMAGCYVGVYNVPGAWLLFEGLDPDRLSEPDLTDWLRHRWAGLPFRRERRAVRTAEKLARYLVTYARWMGRDGPPLAEGEGYDDHDRYERLWRSADKAVYGLGRYANLKLMEFLRRYCDYPIAQLGIRAKGGWSPKEGLALLFPEHAPRLTGPWQDTEVNCQWAEDLAAFAQLRFAADYGLHLDWYNLQVLLCDYKQAWRGRQFPGRSLDSEIEHAAKVSAEFGDALLRPFWEARLELFPRAALGELRGWRHVRKELGGFLAATGQTWSDLKFDYTDTRIPA